MLVVADIVWFVLLSVSLRSSTNLNPSYQQYIGIAALGIRVLRNERVSITNGVSDESIDIAGVDDWYTLIRLEVPICKKPRQDAIRINRFCF